MRKLRVGLIGCSGHSGNALGIIRKSNNMTLVAGAPSHIWEAERISGILESFGKQATYHDTPDALINKEELDLLIIDSLYGLHGRDALLAAKRGIPIYCEKPVASSLDELDQLEKIVKTNDVPFCVMYETRTSPFIATAKKIVTDGVIGKVTVAYGQKSYKRGTRPEWFGDRDLYGGTIPWVAIHAIDWTRYITGMEFQYVSACHDKIVPEGHIGFETAGSIFYRFREGGSCVITFDYFRPIEAQTHGDDRFRIVGTEGIIEGRLDSKEMSVIVNGKGEITPKLEYPKPLFTQFIAGLIGEAPMPSTPDDFFASTRAALAARDAADKNAIITI